jgi:hypothetical protein
MAIKLGSGPECHCSDQSMIMFEKKRCSHLTALLLMTLFCVFVGGYFLGKRAASQELFEQLQDETLADRIQHSLHTFYKPLPTEEDDPKIIEESRIAEVQPSKTEGSQLVMPEQESVVQPTTAPSALYIAQLFGGNLNDSQKFVNRLQERGIETRLIKRSSKSTTDSVVYWYQVVTERYTDRQELERLVANIKKIVKLHDIKIVTVQ